MSCWSRKAISLALAVLLGSLLAAAPAGAHPHAWIDLKTTVLFDDQGRVTGLRQRWVFDEVYSLFAIEGFDSDGDGQPDDEKLWKLAVVNLESLAEYDYFTKLKVDGTQPAYERVTDYETFMNGDLLVLIFTVTLAEPVDPRWNAVTYAIYDPTYYVEVTHAAKRDEPIKFEGAASENCSFALRYPDQNDEMSFFAASLDQNESAGDGLGAYFAEEVSILCE